MLPENCVMRLIDLLNFGVEELQASNIPDHDLDARLLLEFCAGKSRTELYLDGSQPVVQEVQDHYQQLINRRKAREPVAYILGEREFWSLTFHVTQDVLIPRPETEFLLDRVLHLSDAANFTRGHILDLCCGSGVIAVVLARELKRKVIASDISLAALSVTCKNVTRHGVKDRVRLVQSDLLGAYSSERQFSLIVTNPPYVSDNEVADQLEPEVADFEPHLALDGGVAGLEIIKKIRHQISEVLLPGGEFFMEIGDRQGKAVKTLFLKTKPDTLGFEMVNIIQDYSGRDRVVHGRLALQ